MTKTDPPPWSPDTAQTHAAAVIGADGHLVEITANISNGLAALRVLGLPDAATSETRDRVRAAIINSGQSWPGRAGTVVRSRHLRMPFPPVVWPGSLSRRMCGGRWRPARPAVITCA